MKIKIGDEVIRVPTLKFLVQCLFSDPQRVLERWVESHEYAKQQAKVVIEYAFVRKDFVDACIPAEYRNK